VKLSDRILLLVATLLARLIGLDELLDAIMLPLAFIDYYRGCAVGKPILRSSDLVTRGSEQ
jgi:hypothetical protein